MAITVTFPGGKRVDAAVGPFTISTDQPPSVGGEGRAPEPFTYFLASIATCAGIYVLSFCQARGIPTEGVRVIQNQEFDKETRRLTRVRLEIEVPPSFPAKYYEAVKNAADTCAVKKVLANPPEFEIATRVTPA